MLCGIMMQASLKLSGKNTETELVTKTPSPSGRFVSVKSAVAGLLILSIGLALVWIMDSSATSLYLEEVQTNTIRSLAAVRGAAEIAINRRVYLTLGLKAHVSVHPEMTEQEFVDLAALMMLEADGILNVSSMRDNIINDVYPRDGNESAIGVNILNLPDQKVIAEHAIETGRPWLSGPIRLRQGREAFVNRVPVHVTTPGGRPGGGRYWGLVSILIDKQTLVDEIMLSVPPDLSIAVRGRTELGEPGQIFLGEHEIETACPIESEISLPTGSWKLYGVPKRGWPGQAPNAPQRRTLGISISLFAGWLVFLVVKSMYRYRDYAQRLEVAHAALQQSSTAMSEAKQVAETANRAKSEFLANMSHEIRTPLSAVIGITELVLGTSLNRDQRDYLKMVHESGESLLSVINDILDFSKIEAGKLDLMIAPFDLRETVADMMKPMGIRAGGKRVELTCRFAPGVPTIVEGDLNRLRQVLVNLIGNAIKFTDRGEIGLNVVVVEMSHTDAILQFSVRDTGIGIPRDKLKTIFEAFEQADGGTARRFGGTGLGLAICSRLVGLMHGRVWAESELGLGSTFHFTSRFSVSDASRQHSAPRFDGLKGSRVIVVDDSATNLAILDEMLRTWGITPFLVTNADDAMSALNEGRTTDDLPSFLITDMEIPGMNARQFIGAIRADDQLLETAVIAMTSMELAPSDPGMNELGLAAYLRKPIKQSELLDAMLNAQAGTLLVNSEQFGAIDSYPQIQPLDVLLAEDNPFNQRLGIALLEKWGHTVTLVDSGRAAVDAWRDGNFDLIVMDVQMPDMDGLEATRQIRTAELQRGTHIPIVAMTAHAFSGDRERCLNAGMDGYASKPLRIKQLYQEISQFFESQQCLPPRADLMDDVEQQDRSTLNWKQALETCGGDQELLKDVLRVFVNETPAQLVLLRQAINDNDSKSAKRIAHSIKGSVRVFGASPTISILEKIEQCAKNESLPATSTLLEELDGKFHHLLAEISEFVPR